jgi:hypothetical protein
MRMKGFSLFGLLAIIIVGIGLVAATSTPPPPANPTPQHFSSSPPFGGHGTPNPYPPGAPAIHPTRDAATNGGAAFTAADVEQFIQAHGYAGGATVSGGPPTILKILFITSQQASALLNGEDIGRPDNAIVCYVLVAGPFYSSVSLPYGVPTPKAPYIHQTGYEVFDAQTGNLLLYEA